MIVWNLDCIGDLLIPPASRVVLADVEPDQRAAEQRNNKKNTNVEESQPQTQMLNQTSPRLHEISTITNTTFLKMFMFAPPTRGCSSCTRPHCTERSSLWLEAPCLGRHIVIGCINIDYQLSRHRNWLHDCQDTDLRCCFLILLYHIIILLNDQQGWYKEVKLVDL